MRLARLSAFWYDPATLHAPTFDTEIRTMKNAALMAGSAFVAAIVALLAMVSLGEAGDGARNRWAAGGTAAKRPVLRRLAMKEAPIDDTAETLGIRKWSGTFELQRPTAGGEFLIDFYRGGRLVETFKGFGWVNPIDRGEFAIQVVDLDQLPLGDRKPGHLRLITRLAIDGVRSSSQTDIAKDKVRLQPQGLVGQASGGFRPEDGSPTEVPLLYVIYPGPDENWVVQRDAPARIIAQYPGASILIARLVFPNMGAARVP